MTVCTGVYYNSFIDTESVFSEAVEGIGALRMKPLISCLFSVLVIFCLASCSSRPSEGLGEPVVMRAESESVDKPVVGEVVDIARYGRRSSGRHFIGIEWEEPRDIYEVRISGIDRRVAESLRLEWWGSVWPNNGRGGWMRLDDAWNGQWVKVNTKPEPQRPDQFVFRFPP